MSTTSVTYPHPTGFDASDYHTLNAMLNLYGPDGKIQFEADKAAAQNYFLQHVNTRTVFYRSLTEKLAYSVEKDYCDQGCSTSTTPYS